MMRHNRRVLVSLLVLTMAGSVFGQESIVPEQQGWPVPRLSLSPGITTRVSVSGWGAAISANGRYVAFEGPYVYVHDRGTGQTESVSVSSDGTQGNAYSGTASISADGRYVAFLSMASNLVPGDTNSYLDIFVHDRATAQTERVSVASDGTQANGYSLEASISADGRYVAFQSVASNLVPGDTNDQLDVFVHDRLTGQTERVSVSSDEIQGNGDSGFPSISADGRYVAFHSSSTSLVPGDTNGWYDVFVRDRVSGQTERVSVSSDEVQGNGGSFYASISADGCGVAFESEASNLVPGDTNGHSDILVRDRLSGQTERVSVPSDGGQGDSSSSDPSISADGRYVAFDSWATNLVGGDTNGHIDVFVRDRAMGQTERVSVSSDGAQGTGGHSDSPSMSASGRYVAFESYAHDLVCDGAYEDKGVFLHDREGSGDNTISGRVTEANTAPVSGVTISAGPTISDTTGTDGGYLLEVAPCLTYTVTPMVTGYAFWPSYRTVGVPPAATAQDFFMVARPVSTTLNPGEPGALIYTDTQGLPTGLSFPAGAVTETTTVTLTPTMASGSARLAFAGHAFDLEAYAGGVHQPGFVFSLPVTVTIAYSELDVGAVREESELSLLWWAGAEWEEAAETCDPPSAYVRDLDGRVLRLPICHLSTFGLFGPTHRVYLPLVLKGG